MLVGATVVFQTFDRTLQKIAGWSLGAKIVTTWLLGAGGMMLAGWTCETFFPAREVRDTAYVVALFVWLSPCGLFIHYALPIARPLWQTFLWCIVGTGMFWIAQKVCDWAGLNNRVLRVVAMIACVLLLQLMVRRFHRVKV